MLKRVLADIRRNPGITLEYLMDLHAADAEYMSAVLARLVRDGEIVALETRACPPRSRKAQKEPASRICFFSKVLDAVGESYRQSVVLHS
ncbi:hypothetical protein [Acidithiobacillus sp. AMEEHan]|uniref:hypothetical protein n=1 Tax=Acidithiobacillus sp. AMEEHan TaxID=2994951 RepID=UPI0027E52CB3|nr:hypothetical protein [Acidithiobacillus sp. AMEEHan]